MKQNPSIDDLSRPRIYVEEIERLHAGAKRHRLRIEPAGLHMGDIHTHRHEIARVLSRTIRCGEYRPAPLRKTIARIEGKERVLYQSHALDIAVTAAVARVLTARVDPHLSPHVYSYRKGMSQRTATDALLRFVKEHRRATADPKQRGLHVLKRDIAAYGDAIATHENSPLWQQLAEIQKHNGHPRADFFSPLLKRLIRPDIINTDGVQRVLDKGVPTGSSIQPVCCNLYLSPLDHALQSIPGAFYARFGDDFVFAHPNADIARHASSLIEQIVASLELTMRPEKQKNFFFNGAGRPSEQWPEATPCVHFDYLGFRISFRGDLGLKREKTGVFLSDMRKRIRNVLSLLPDQSTDIRLRAACTVVNTAIDPDGCLGQRSASSLLRVVGDRAQLAQFDHLLALEIAQQVSGIRGVRAFRRISPAALRNIYNLLSLVHERNRFGKRRPS